MHAMITEPSMPPPGPLMHHPNASGYSRRPRDDGFHRRVHQTGLLIGSISPGLIPLRGAYSSRCRQCVPQTTLACAAGTNLTCAPEHSTQRMLLPRRESTGRYIHRRHSFQSDGCSILTRRSGDEILGARVPRCPLIRCVLG